MADVPDDVRRAKIAEALRPFMAEGEELIVRNHEGEITAIPPSAVKLRQEHPRLYGQLLSGNEQLQSGCGGPLAGLVIAGVVCVGLTLGWWDEVLGAQAAGTLRESWWFYVFLFILGIGIPSYLSEVRSKLTYRGLRSDLVATMEAENLDRDLLVSMIQDDPNLTTIGRQLKLDRGMMRLRPGGP